MGEIKSVKVDNWGVFFLQKLQNFFNKTDYCDLTLQFNDNSQLKVHRLVLSACTDYFNVLEQTCEMVDDVLIMPLELQADVVVPIVNFMYTGTLEFELKMYGRLLRTAKEMNMTVLLKLLEAHRRTMEGTASRPQPTNKTTPKVFRRITNNTTPTKTTVVDRSYNSPSTSSTVQRRTSTSYTPQYKTLQIKPVTQNFYSKAITEPAQILTKYPHTKTPLKGPSRFECSDDTIPPETFERSFDNISYESKPLICKEEPDAYDYDNLIRKHETYASPFEQLRRGYTNNKRPASSVSSYDSPPEKKPNIQDVKEYAEQQRVRKQIAEQFDDDHEYDELLDDEFQNDDDDDDYVPPASYQKQLKQQQSQQAKQAQSQRSITIRQEKNQRPTIVVKDTTSANVNHAKIISEVLRKYPHLVKSNKNIKLKIMPQSNIPQKIVIKKENVESSEKSKEVKPPFEANVKKSSPSPHKSTSTTSITTATTAAQPRRIDSKTMHALIALGAENRTGPWLCLRCGDNGRPISIPSYRGFRRHLINTHKEKIDPSLCEHCGWRSSGHRELCLHMLEEHSVKSPSTYEFPQCDYCKRYMIDYDALEKHINEKHPDKKHENQTCLYCSKRFSKEVELYAHMRDAHKKQAIEDGIFSEEEEVFGSEGELQQNENEDQKIKILSDISLPKNIPIIQNSEISATSPIELEPSSEAEGLNSVATGIATSLGLIDNTSVVDDSQVISSEFINTDSSQGPKFVNAEGNEMELTPAQREEIISQLDHHHDGVVMVLNEEPFNVAEPLNDSSNATTTETQFANDNMFIVYNESSENPDTITASTSNSEKAKSQDNWVEKESLVSEMITSKTVKSITSKSEDEQEIDEEITEQSDATTERHDDEKESPSQGKSVVKDPLEMKLRLLTDWTDDEDEIDQISPKSPEKIIKSDENEKRNNEEILFETIADIERNNEIKNESSISEKEEEAKEGKCEEEQPSSPVKAFEDKEDDQTNKSEEEKGDEEEHKAEKEDDIFEENEADSETKGKTEEILEKEPGATEEKIVQEVSEESVVKEGKQESEEKNNSDLITKEELRNLISDWAEDDDSDDEDL